MVSLPDCQSGGCRFESGTFRRDVTYDREYALVMGQTYQNICTCNLIGKIMDL